MKNWNKILVLLAVGMMAASCIIRFGGSSFVFGDTTEEGIDYTEIREVGSFRAISLDLPCNLYYSQAPTQEVRVESTEELAGKVITVVENGTLKLKMEEGTYPKIILRMVVSSPDIESLQTHGSGDIIQKGALRVSGDLTVKTHGSGDIQLGDIDCKAFTAHSSGSGDIQFTSVSCADFSGTVNGSGDLDVVRVDCAGFNVATTGSGDISVAKVIAKGKAEVRTSGSGDISLTTVAVGGDMELKTTGSGDITVKGSCHAVTANTTGSGSISGNLIYGSISSHSSGSGSVRL